MQPVPSRPTWKNAMHLGFRRGRTLRVHFIEKVALILLRAYNYIAMDFKPVVLLNAIWKMRSSCFAGVLGNKQRKQILVFRVYV